MWAHDRKSALVLRAIGKINTFILFFFFFQRTRRAVPGERNARSSRMVIVDNALHRRLSPTLRAFPTGRCLRKVTQERQRIRDVRRIPFASHSSPRNWKRRFTARKGKTKRNRKDFFLRRQSRFVSNRVGRQGQTKLIEGSQSFNRIARDGA